jgi:hypothetical protein
MFYFESSTKLTRAQFFGWRVEFVWGGFWMKTKDGFG